MPGSGGVPEAMSSQAHLYFTLTGDIIGVVVIKMTEQEFNSIVVDIDYYNHGYARLRGSLRSV